jgi:hypothetical protein
MTPHFIANNTTTKNPTELAARSATPTKRNPDLSASPRFIHPGRPDDDE